MPFKPLLASNELPPIEEYERHLPLYASYKVDGIRGTIIDGVPTSRSGRPLPSAYVKNYKMLERVDGEFVALNARPGQIYRDSHSAVMTHGSQEPLNFHVFDMAISDVGYRERYDMLKHTISQYWHAGYPYRVTVLDQEPMLTLRDILAYEQKALDLGYEGLILRSPTAHYKNNRSTFNEGILLKLVRKLTSEAEVIGFNERMHNGNEATTGPLGYTERSSHKANLVGLNTLGSLQCRDIHTGVEFDIGIGKGWDDAFRKEVWDNQLLYRGKIQKYEYKPYGVKDKPRQPCGLGWRDPMDL